MTKLLAALALAVALPVSVASADVPADSHALPSADRIAPYIKQKLGNNASADVQLCVAADGHVTKVGILKGSTFAAFDKAVVHDVGDWQFAKGTATRCVKTTIAYHVK